MAARDDSWPPRTSPLCPEAASGTYGRPVDARFFTISDPAFFVGTVALVNSLRITGHEQEVVVLDRGLTARQRELLAPSVTLVDVPAGHADPYLVKPFPALVDTDGVVVLLDSDMVVTDSLEPVLERAAAGAICVFPDHPADLDRWFAEWHELFGLGAPLRRGDYLNAGFVAVSTARWPGFFPRWWEACARIPAERETLTDPEPLAQLDQDALNALLLSEIPEGAVGQLPSYEWDLRRVSVVDPRTLECRAEGVRQPLLHAWLRPKVWQGRENVHANAYERLLPRILFAPDAAIRLDANDVPRWLRPGAAGQVALHGLRAYNALPEVRARARRAPRRALRGLRALAGRPRARGDE